MKFHIPCPFDEIKNPVSYPPEPLPSVLLPFSLWHNITKLSIGAVGNPHSGQEWVTTSFPFSLFLISEFIQLPHVGHLTSKSARFFIIFHQNPELNLFCTNPLKFIDVSSIILCDHTLMFLKSDHFQAHRSIVNIICIWILYRSPILQVRTQQPYSTSVVLEQPSL